MVTVTDLLDAAITAQPAVTTAATIGAHDPADQPTATDYTSALTRLCAIPGGGPDSMRAVIGEIGLDISVFDSAQPLCSWATLAPRTAQPGRKTSRARTRKSNPYLTAALAQIATGAAKTDTFLGERYRRLINRCPRPRPSSRCNAPS